MSNGEGCSCMAYSESECGCPDVDWTDQRIYDLQDKVESLSTAYAELIELSKRSLQKFKDTGVVGSWSEGEDYKMNVKQQLIADIIYGYCQGTYHLEFDISDIDEMTHNIIAALKAIDENE